MSIVGFRSFQGTPILFFSLQVLDELPLLADESVPGILREAWLHSALRDGWLVGAYRIRPDRVSLFASPVAVRAAAAEHAWVAIWQAVTTTRINAATQGTGRIWAECLPPIPVTTEEDYVALRATMGTGAPEMRVGGALAPDGCEGMIWQLLPDGEPMPATCVPLGMT